MCALFALTVYSLAQLVQLLRPAVSSQPTQPFAPEELLSVERANV